MRIILSYDGQGDHTSFKKLCVKNGFGCCLKLPDGKAYKLPNTTFVGMFDSVEAAVDLFRRLAIQNDMDLEKMVAAECGLPTLYSDEYC